jgi:NAD(P)-dependent dehydrogenase (short-subunit alcohol dehydrogenase family)
VLINNASSPGPTRLKVLADRECEKLQEALAVNVLGPFRLTKALAPIALRGPPRCLRGKRRGDGS